MNITRRTDYAIRLIAALMTNNENPLSVREAAKVQNVPYAFARSIQHDLALHGFIRSTRGAYGGMILTKDPETLTLLEIIEAVQGSINVAVCTNSPGYCEREQACQFHKVWEGANQLLHDYLSSTTVKKLLEGKPAFLTSASADVAAPAQ